jgi:hypothetical protein
MICKWQLKPSAKVLVTDQSLKLGQRVWIWMATLQGLLMRVVQFKPVLWQIKTLKQNKHLHKAEDNQKTNF